MHERQSFSAFGQRRLLTGTWGERGTSELTQWNFSFHGQFVDSESGWSNYGYRYMSNGIGRWTARDPLTEAVGPNHYVFSENSPLVVSDMFGLKPLSAADVIQKETATQCCVDGVWVNKIKIYVINRDGTGRLLWIRSS